MAGSVSRTRSEPAQRRENDSDLFEFDDAQREYLSPQGGAGGTRTRLIIGIDFGTTFSGASIAVLHPRDDPSEVKISPVRNWKGDLPGNTTSNKVPTEIAYDAAGKAYWGFDVPEELREDTYRWLKLLLEPEIFGTRNWSDAVDPKATKALLSSQRKTAIEVAADYVRLLWEHVKNQIINEHSKATYDFAEKSIVLTIPAVWSEMAKHNTYLVAKGAGLASEDLSLQTISEPEAAAIAVLRDRGTLLKADDCYVVVDAGGGTVDLTSYLLTSIAPIRLEELIAGDGDVCGAVFLNINFENLLRTYLGTATITALPRENLSGIINDFECGVRKVFDGEERAYKVAVPGVPASSCEKIKAGYLRLSAADLMPVFMPVVEKVERLVRKQVRLLLAMKRKPKAILLVGGFGTNRYLAKRLKGTYEPRDGGHESPIEVLQPNIGWESIANGAVRCEAMGIGNIMSFRIARFNIGVLYDSRFKEGRDFPEERYICKYDGTVMAKHKIKWYLTRGERIKPGQQIDFPLEHFVYDSVFKPPRRKFFLTMPLVQSNEDNAPPRETKRTKDFVTLDLPWDLKAHPLSNYKQRKSVSGKPYRAVNFMLHMRQGPAKMEFSYSVDGENRGSIESVDFQDLQMQNPRLMNDDDDDETLLDTADA